MQNRRQLIVSCVKCALEVVHVDVQSKGKLYIPQM